MAEAVIFDLDGTLVELFELHLRGFQHSFRKNLGVEFTREDLQRFYGTPAEDIARMACREKCPQKEIDYIILLRDKRWFFNENIQDRVDLLPGVEELLEDLKGQGIKLAIATSSNRSNARAIIKSSGLDKYFETILDRDDIVKGKPDPEIFLLTAKRLGIEPENCVVVEDSTHGIEAGKKAGMRVIAVASGQHTSEQLREKNPDLLVKDLTDSRVLECIKAL